MLSFQMQADNFDTMLGGGRADNLRTTSAGLRLDIVPAQADANSLALWRPSSSGLSDVSGNGRHLSLTGGGLCTDEGLLLVAASQEGAQAAFSATGHDALVMETWLRLPLVPTSGSGGLLAAGTSLSCSLQVVGGQHRLYLLSFEGDDWDVSELHHPLGQLQANVWMHVAAQWQRGQQLTVWINGLAATAVATTTAEHLISGAALFSVGQLSAGSHLGGEYDQVHVSRIGRYPAAAPPKRYRTMGSFVSPAFDGARAGAAWLAAEVEYTTGGDSEVLFEIRAGDELDVGGQVTQPWRPADGTSYGRYAQWRATLTAGGGACNIITPTVAAVTLSASEAGYNVYRGAGRQAACIDYETIAARTGPEALSVEIGDLSPATVHWFGVRSVSACGLESPTATAEVRLELDAAGQAVPPRPAPVAALEGVSAGDGGVHLQWLATEGAGETEADVYRVYGAAAEGAIDYGQPLGEVAARSGRETYHWSGGAWADGSEVLLAVRAETAAGGVDDDPPTVSVRISSHPPAPPGWIAAEAMIGQWPG